MNPLKLICLGSIRAYQWGFSPLKAALLGTAGCCRFSPTCSHYAFEAIQTHGVATGLALAGRRVLRCHPWGGAGPDPVPAPRAR